MAKSPARAPGCASVRDDVGDDLLGLLRFVLQLQDARPRAVAARRAQHLVVPVAVERDQRVGELQDGAGRAVVLLQPHDLRLGPVVA